MRIAVQIFTGLPTECRRRPGRRRWRRSSARAPRRRRTAASGCIGACRRRVFCLPSRSTHRRRGHPGAEAASLQAEDRHAVDPPAAAESDVAMAEQARIGQRRQGTQLANRHAGAGRSRGGSHWKAPGRRGVCWSGSGRRCGDAKTAFHAKTRARRATGRRCSDENNPCDLARQTSLDSGHLSWITCRRYDRNHFRNRHRGGVPCRRARRADPPRLGSSR